MSKNNKTNSSIKCDVDSCKYNNCEEGYCELDEIKVGCVCDSEDCRECEETVCESFDTKDVENENDSDEDEYNDEKITDTVYEVEAESDELIEEDEEKEE